MKRLSLFFLIFFLGLNTFLYSKEEAQMQLTRKVGEVKAKANNQSQWLAAQLKMMLTKGDSLKTGYDSYAELALNPENRFRIKENSVVEIDKVMDVSRDPSGSVVKLVSFNLKSGALIAKLDNLPKGVRLSVGSPTAVAGASGTEFSVVVESLGQTHVAVLESKVSVTSVNEPNKMVWVTRFEKVDVAPWDVVLLQAKGTGLLSEKILGEKFVQQAKQDIVFVGIGIGRAPDDAEEKDKIASGKAHMAALRNLTDRVLDIEMGPEQKLGDLLDQDMELSEQVFRVLADAQITRSNKLPDGSIEEEVEVNLQAIAEALGRPITSVRQTVRPISLAEYGSKFGPLARVTTRRAAQVDALRKLTELIYGSVIDSQTTVKDLEATNDRIVTSVRGVVQGAQIVKEVYFSDGSVSVEVQAPGQQIKKSLTQVAGDIFGLNYMSSPTRIGVSDFETYKELEKI